MAESTRRTFSRKDLTCPKIFRTSFGSTTSPDNLHADDRSMTSSDSSFDVSGTHCTTKTRKLCHRSCSCPFLQISECLGTPGSVKHQEKEEANTRWFSTKLKTVWWLIQFKATGFGHILSTSSKSDKIGQAQAKLADIQKFQSSCTKLGSDCAFGLVAV